jgi:hypothetical protein
MVMRARMAATCQTRPMRIIGSLLGLFTWRLRLGLSGLRLRFRGLLSAVMVLGGAGAALGYAVARRMLSEQDETSTRPEA